MKTIKAGCYLIDFENKKVALVYREKYNDYSFPKGHLEEGETVEECALRETAEETKRNGVILKNIKEIKEEYTTPRGESCECYMFVAKDVGKSDNNSLDTHLTVWVPIEEVEEKLTYQNLKNSWLSVKDKIIELLN